MCTLAHKTRKARPTPSGRGAKLGRAGLEQKRVATTTPALQRTIGNQALQRSLRQAIRGGGRSLPQSTRSFMERRFGCDFSSVRTHSDVQAQALAERVNARAFTRGKDILFGGSQYRPGCRDGQRLLAHELAHVVQQSSGQSAGLVQREEETDATALPTPASSTAAGAPTAEITLETGNIGAGFLNNLVHQQVCVDSHSAGTDAKRCFSFAATGVQWPQFSRTWLGWSSPVVGAILKGQVYEPDPVPSATVVGRHSPTAAQGANWLSYMTGTRLGLQDGYSVARHNCRKYSQWEFRDAPTHW